MKTIPCDDLLKRGMLQTARGFGQLAEPEQRALARIAEVREYAPGETLFLAGEKATGLFIVAQGAIVVSRCGMDGRRQILHVFDEAGDVCGEAPVFEGGSYPADAEAERTSRTLYLRRADFLETARRHPDILLTMLAALSRRLMRFVDLIEDLSLKDVTARLAKRLIELSEKDGCRDTISLASSKTALAEQLGTIPETVSRTLRKLQNQGLIAVDGRSVSLLDRAGLKAVANNSAVG